MVEVLDTVETVEPLRRIVDPLNPPTADARLTIDALATVDPRFPPIAVDPLRPSGVSTLRLADSE